MPGENADADSVKSDSAASGVTEEKLQQMIQKVTMGIFKDALPRLVQKSIQDSIPSMLDKFAEEAMKSEPAETEPAAGNVADVGKTTLKSLQAQIEQLSRGIKERDEQVKVERQRASEIRLRSEVHAQFAKHMGAESPHLTPYVNHYLSQFVDRDGQAVRKSKNEYGEDVFVPVSQAIEEMFKGDLKHLLPSRTANLPRLGAAPVRPGQQIANQPQQGAARNNPLMQIAQELSAERPEAAQILADDATKIGVHTPLNRNNQ